MDVEGDLLLPLGRPLHARGGTTLRFAPGAVLLSGEALLWQGGAEAPIVLEPRDDSWAGLVVIDAAGRSELTHVVVRGADVVDRGGWQTTGGVSFYFSHLLMRRCRIEDARGEDALNVFGAECDLIGCVLQGGPSDLFDGDFVTGRAENCSFSDSGEDAVDVSGSVFDVVGCNFQRIGDKALSIGERSRVTASDCSVTSCSIVAAVKDGSEATLRDFQVERAEQYGLAVYVKKPEYGPSRVLAERIRLGSTGRGAHLVQVGCTLTLDGRLVPGEPVDVERLYRQGILGK